MKNDSENAERRHSNGSTLELPRVFRILEETEENAQRRAAAILSKDGNNTSGSHRGVNMYPPKLGGAR